MVVHHRSTPLPFYVGGNWGDSNQLSTVLVQYFMEQCDAGLECKYRQVCEKEDSMHSSGLFVKMKYLVFEFSELFQKRPRGYVVGSLW